MIDDPLSLLSLCIWLMAAGMYPLGFLFGACSPCCQDDDDDDDEGCPFAIEFNRCVRWERLDAPALQTTGFASLSGIDEGNRTRGFSVRVNSPLDVGGTLVAHRVLVAPSVRVLSAARLLSSGEFAEETVTPSHTNGPSTELSWVLKINGEDVPLIAPTFSGGLGSLVYGIPLFPGTGSHFGNASVNPHAIENLSATILAEVIDAWVVGSSPQRIDGGVFTREYLKSLVSPLLTKPSSVNSRVLCELQFFPPPSESLVYVPSGTSNSSQRVDVQYVIRMTRGNASTHFTVAFRLIGQGQSFPSPSPFQTLPPTAPSATYSDSPLASTDITSEEREEDGAVVVTIPSHAVPGGPIGTTTQGLQVTLPGVEYTIPAAAQENGPGFSIATPPGQQYWRYIDFNSNATLAFGYTLRLRWSQSIPSATKGQILFAPQQASVGSTIYDVDQVFRFLSGDESISASFSNGLWEATVQPENALCAQGLCVSGQAGNQISRVSLASPISMTGTITRKPLPATINTSGFGTVDNLCFGLDDPPEKFSLFLTHTADQGCAYRTAGPTCRVLQNSIGWFNQGGQPGIGSAESAVPYDIPPAAFYCGDLLWTLDNGPCTTLVETDTFIAEIGEDEGQELPMCLPPGGILGVALAGGRGCPAPEASLEWEAETAARCTELCPDGDPVNVNPNSVCNEPWPNCFGPEQAVRIAGTYVFPLAGTGCNLDNWQGIVLAVKEDGTIVNLNYVMEQFDETWCSVKRPGSLAPRQSYPQTRGFVGPANFPGPPGGNVTPDVAAVPFFPAKASPVQVDYEPLALPPTDGTAQTVSATWPDIGSYQITSTASRRISDAILIAPLSDQGNTNPLAAFARPAVVVVPGYEQCRFNNDLGLSVNGRFAVYSSARTSNPFLPVSGVYLVNQFSTLDSICVLIVPSLPTAANQDTVSVCSVDSIEVVGGEPWVSAVLAESNIGRVRFGRREEGTGTVTIRITTAQGQVIDFVMTRR